MKTPRFNEIAIFSSLFIFYTQKAAQLEHNECNNNKIEKITKHRLEHFILESIGNSTGNIAYEIHIGVWLEFHLLE